MNYTTSKMILKKEANFTLRRLDYGFGLTKFELIVLLFIAFFLFKLTITISIH